MNEPKCEKCGRKLTVRMYDGKEPEVELNACFSCDRIFAVDDPGYIKSPRDTDVSSILSDRIRNKPIA